MKQIQWVTERPATFLSRLENVPAHKLGEYPGDSVNVTYYDDIYVEYRFNDTIYAGGASDNLPLQKILQ